MAIKQEMRTFKQIVDQIMSLMKYQSTDALSRTRIQADVQRAYLTEIVPFHEWPWLRNKVQIQANEYYGTGMASVTQGSVAVTLTETILNTKKNYFFSIEGLSEIYTIRNHVGGSTSLILDLPYTGQTTTTAKFKIWTDSLPLPAEAMEISEVSNPFMVRPMEGVGLQELRRYSATRPKAEGRPYYFTLSEKTGPKPYTLITGMPQSVSRASDGVVKTIVFATSLGSSAANMIVQVGDRIRLDGAGSFDYNIEAIVSEINTTVLPNDTIVFSGLAESTQATIADVGITVAALDSDGYDQQKQLLIYPSIYNSKTTLTVDYIKEIEPLVNDNDEPALPLADRVVLFWYGLSYAYSRERNPEDAVQYRSLADNRLARMAGRANESVDKPMFVPSRVYLNAKRNPTRSRDGKFGAGWGGGGSTTNPLGTPLQVAIFGTDGTLQSSSDVSTRELDALDGINGNIEARLNGLGLPTGSVGDRVLVSSTSVPPAIIESSVAAESLDYLVGSAGLVIASLSDAQSSATSTASFLLANSTVIQISYSLTRGGDIESGIINLVSNGSTVGFSQGAVASTAVLGVNFSADISSGSMRLLYTSTSTGSGATFKYKVNSWLA